MNNLNSTGCSMSQCNNIKTCEHKPAPCKKEGCSCKCDEKNVDNCNYFVDEKSIFLNDTESMVKTFDLKDVWTELCINGTVGVPVQKLSIEQIDSVNAKVQIISKRVVVTPAVYDETSTVIKTVKNEEGKITTGRKLVVEGLICTNVSYVGLTADQGVNSFHGQIPFSAFIVLPQDADLSDNYEVYALIEEICVKSVCERSVNFTFAVILTAEKIESSNCSKAIYENSGIDCISTLSSCCSGDCSKEQPVIKGVCSKVQVENLIKDDTETLWTEISVPELLTIPNCKPNAVQILSVTSSVEVMCQKIIVTPKAVANYEGLELTGVKLLVNGVLRQRITYISDTDCRSVHSAHFDVPVSAYIVLPEGTSPLNKYKIRTCTEDIFACVLNDRQFFKNTTLFIKAESIACL